MIVMDSPDFQDIMARCLRYLPHSKTGDYKFVGSGDGVFFIGFYGIFCFILFFQQWEMGKVAIGFVWAIRISVFNLRWPGKTSTVVYIVVLKGLLAVIVLVPGTWCTSELMST
jgi:hypothetical protein